jgi:hypothetical protein
MTNINNKKLAKIFINFLLKSENFLLVAPIIRKKLLAENVEKLLFIHHNLKIYTAAGNIHSVQLHTNKVLIYFIYLIIFLDRVSSGGYMASLILFKFISVGCKKYIMGIKNYCYVFAFIVSFLMYFFLFFNNHFC